MKTIEHALFFPHKPKVVWDYLTKPELIVQWLMETDFKPFVGCDFQFKTRPLPTFNFDGIFHCKVVELVPLQKLSYSMKGGPAPGKTEIDSLVVWTLQEKDKGTELRIVHSGFNEPENLLLFSAMNEGWNKNIQKIFDLIQASTA
jgi:uncharacterized protein YndB with AHSA1/START domain